ncbi:MAG: PLDc N-terminal domain-containing protein [Nocardioides sp.]|uniref:PLD nuclease N-terminal domain-containing protein n=1 Tax=Nocardioides sp. TaxID=35761 RepID=UPI00239E7694|nr:PLDc N-terminal domain-containing protein [Nocardioides sp.]MDE0774947.1 PLDc N-terminal domain-containing protein [Nocardioides sp.]
MIKIQLFLGFVTFALWVYCLISVITTPQGSIRNLQKPIWLILVLLFPLVGSIAWLVAGRPESAPRRPGAYERNAPAYPEYDRPGRAAAVDQAADEEFLRGVRARAEEQRKRHEQARRERERLAAEERARYRSRPPAVDGAPEDA